jgi:RHS repeat-associated protein
MEEQFALSPKWWGTPYLFNGKELDARTSLYYYGARYFDPGLSVWLSVDPKTEKALGWTPYRYAFNNPIRIIDPDGQFETRFGAWLYNASQGFKGNVHKSITRPGEYYVGRRIKSSSEIMYDIKWGSNTEKPIGGVVNAFDIVSSSRYHNILLSNLETTGLA